MVKVMTIEEGKRIVIDTEKDDCIYYAPNNPPNTGTAYTRGTDLYAHTTEKGNIFFYFYNWSMWQGENCNIELITKEEAEKFLLHNIGGNWGLELEEAGEIEKKYGFDLIKETA